MTRAWSFENLPAPKARDGRKRAKTSYIKAARNNAPNASGMGMNRFFAVAVISLAASVGLASQAQAKGCIRGAIAGGIAGHYAGHHAVAGAIGGCIAARHYYKQKRLQQQQIQQPGLQGAGAYR